VPKINAEDAERRARREIDGGRPSEYSEALDRGLAVLAAFNGRERLTQAELAASLGLSRATVRRSLLTLTHLGYVIAESRTYRLAPRVLTLASAYLTANPVSSVVQPACEQLCERLGASATAAVLDGVWAVMVARAVPRNALGVGQGIGFRVSAPKSALGRVLLSGLTEEQLLDHLQQHGDGTDTVPQDQLIADLGEVRSHGHAYVIDEVETGFHSVAVPLRRWDGAQIAALNVGARVERISPDDMFAVVLPELRRTAADVQPQLV
jgi:IclR family transcriptional regulator, pca regulon regulatory protein